MAYPGGTGCAGARTEPVETFRPQPVGSGPARSWRGHERVATTALAAAASTAGVSFADSTGASIPLAGFAQLTLIFSLVGVGIAAVMARKVRRPRRAFVRTTVALTVLSFVPDLTFGFDARSVAALITLHIVAAAIVVPTLAGRLAHAR
jgi:amino acid transporter